MLRQVRVGSLRLTDYSVVGGLSVPYRPLSSWSSRGNTRTLNSNYIYIPTVFSV